MSDVISRVGGREAKVTRQFRAERGVQFVLRERVDVWRVDTNGELVEKLVCVKPGMWVYGMVDGMNEQTYEECKRKLDRLDVYYVLEILQKGATPERLTGGSDDADLLVLPCICAKDLPDSIRTKTPKPLNDTDLVVGDHPFYMPVDAVVATMDAIIGTGQPTPSLTGARRVSYYITNVDEDFKPESNVVSIKTLHADSEVLQAPYEHGTQFLSVQHVSDSTAQKRSHTPSGRSYTPTGRPRGRPPKKQKAVTSTTPTVDVDADDDDDDDDDDDNDDDIQIEAPAKAARTLSVSMPPPPPPLVPLPLPASVPVSESTSAPVKEVPAKEGPPPLVSSAGGRKSFLRALTAADQARFLAYEKWFTEVPANCSVDLARNTWQKYKPQLTAYILKIIGGATLSPEQAAFYYMTGDHEALASFATTRLGGEFGAFVDDTLRANRDLTAQFLSRVPDPIMPVAHCVFLRPAVYYHLCSISKTWGVASIDEDIVAAARKLKQERAARSQQ